jgi:DNA-binding CsgD family transcriptional regulator
MKRSIQNPSLTLHNYMSQVSVDSTGSDHIFDLIHYLNKAPGLGRDLAYSPVSLFVLDYRLKGYHHVGQNIFSIIGAPREALLEGGIFYSHNQMHPEDLFVFAETIFSRRLEHMQNVSTEERSKYWYSHNYRFTGVNGKSAHILQHTTVLDVDCMGNPLILLGFCTDISHHKQDNRIVHTISRCDEGIGMTYILKDIYFPASDEGRLSPREVEILKWVIEGLSSKAIADRLNLSTHTVNTHRKNMLEKTNAKNTADLLKFAFKHGML